MNKYEVGDGINASNGNISNLITKGAYYRNSLKHLRREAVQKRRQAIARRDALKTSAIIDELEDVVSLFDALVQFYDIKIALAFNQEGRDDD